MAAKRYIDVILRSKDHASQKFKQFNTRLGMTQQQMAMVKTAAIGAGVALASVVTRELIQTWVEYENSMARVKALTGAVGGEFDKLNDKARELGEATVFSASEAAKGMSAFALAGFKSNEIIDAMGPTLDLAAAGQMEVGESAEIAAKIMGGMGLRAKDLAHAVDVLTKAFVTAQTDLPMLGEAMKYVGPLGVQAGKGIEELTAAIMVMSNAGIQGQQAGTSLRQILIRLSGGVPAATAQLNKLGVRTATAGGKLRNLADIVDDLNKALAGKGETERAAILFQIFGAKAVGIAPMIAAGGDELRKFQKELEDSGGTAERIANIQLETLGGSFKILISKITGAGIAIGDYFNPALKAMVAAGKAAIDTLSGFGGALKDLLDLPAAGLEKHLNFVLGDLGFGGTGGLGARSEFAGKGATDAMKEAARMAAEKSEEEKKKEKDYDELYGRMQWGEKERREWEEKEDAERRERARVEWEAQLKAEAKQKEAAFKKYEQAMSGFEDALAREKIRGIKDRWERGLTEIDYEIESMMKSLEEQYADTAVDTTGAANVIKEIGEMRRKALDSEKKEYEAQEAARAKEEEDAKAARAKIDNDRKRKDQEEAIRRHKEDAESITKGQRLEATQARFLKHAPGEAGGVTREVKLQQQQVAEIKKTQKAIDRAAKFIVSTVRSTMDFAGANI